MRWTVIGMIFAVLWQADDAIAGKNYTTFKQFGGAYYEETRKVFGDVPACAVKHVMVDQKVIDESHPERTNVGADANEGCVVRYSFQWWRAATPRQRCVLMVHEYGHLMGFEHSDDPNNVMYETPIRSSACRTLNIRRQVMLELPNGDYKFCWNVWGFTNFESDTGLTREMSIVDIKTTTKCK